MLIVSVLNDYLSFFNKLNANHSLFNKESRNFVPYCLSILFNVMKTVLFKCIFLFSLAGFFIGCNTGAKKISENPIQFDSLFVEKTYHFFDVDTNPKCLLQINFVYPVNYSNKEILNLTLQQFVSVYFGDDYKTLTPKDAAEKYADNFINAYKEIEKEFKVEMENHDMEEFDETWYANEESSSNQIVYNRNDLLSLVVSKGYYYGGAHGGHNYANRVIDLKTGRRIMEDEIFEDDYHDDLAKIIIDVIALSHNVEMAELENIGFYNLDEISSNNNFYVDEIGITYTYNEYEIAAYVLGAVSVQIPYENIRHLLRRESPLSDIAFR